MTETFFAQTLPANTAKLLQEIAKKHPDFVSSFYLSGGTALSLQLGHRESEDLDFFSEQSFYPERIEQQLLSFGKLSDTELAKGTLNTYLKSVKLQFLEYPYRLLEPLVEWNGIKLSSALDIACTKLQTVGMRGSKKDFIDIHVLLQQFSLQELLVYTKKKYTESDYSEAHILKSLIYFEDAESQPMPRMHIDISWEKVKNSLISTIRSLPVV
jgi:hypothetical protein